jgi:hypothetical protein
LPFEAYNNVVEKVNLMQNAVEGRSERYILYLYNRLKASLNVGNAEFEVLREKGTSCLLCQGNEASLAQMRQIANEHLSDIFAIGYKYDFFKTKLVLPLLSNKDKELLYAALVSADYKEDKRYASRRINFSKNYSLDGVYNFRLGELRARWLEVIEYIPTDFGRYELEGFLDYIVGENEGKAYLKNGKVYDSNYRELQKSELLGKNTVCAEVLLAGAGTVYCFGKVEEETEEFLRKYYKEKVVFC